MWFCSKEDVAAFGRISFINTDVYTDYFMFSGGKRLITFQIGRKTCENPAEAEKLVEFPKGSDPLALDELMREFNLTRAEAIALIGKCFNTFPLP